MDKFTTILRKARLRATTPRLAILAALARSPQALSIEALYGQLRRTGVDRVTLYRNADALANAGIVRTVDFGHGHAHYELEQPDHHHHHLICRSCGAVQDITLRAETQMITAATRRHRFLPQTHSFEIFGLCAKCQ